MKRTWVSIVVVALIFCFVGFARAAETHSRFVTGFVSPEPPQNVPYIISNTLNFADLKTGVLSGVSRDDTVQLLPIPAGTIVKSVGINIYSAWSTVGTTCYGVTIGDGAGVTGWMPSVDFGPSATGVSGSYASEVSGFATDAEPVTTGEHNMEYLNLGDYARVGGKYYSTADTIDAVIPAIQAVGGIDSSDAAVTDFVLRIWAECVKPSTQYRYKRTGE